jgi:hypothetical protein
LQAQALELLGRRVILHHQADEELDHAGFHLRIVERTFLAGVGRQVKEQRAKGMGLDPGAGLDLARG